MVISCTIKSKLRPNGADANSFSWIGERHEQERCKLLRRIGDQTQRSYYRGFMLNSLSIYEGTDILVKVVDEHFGETFENYDIARVIRCFQKGPNWVEVQWYTRIDKVKKFHMKNIPAGLPALDGDLEIVKDMWGYGTDIEIDSIAGLCCIVETTASTDPESIHRPPKAVGPLYVCRFIYKKKSPWLFPVTKESLERPLSLKLSNNIDKENMVPENNIKRDSLVENGFLRSQEKRRKSYECLFGIRSDNKKSPVVSLIKLENFNDSQNLLNSNRKNVKRKLLDLSPTDKLISKKSKIDDESSTEIDKYFTSDSNDKDEAKSRIKSVGNIRGLKSNEIYLLLSDEDDDFEKESNIPQKKSLRISFSKSKDRKLLKPKVNESIEPLLPLSTVNLQSSKRKPQLTEKLKNTSIKLSSNNRMINSESVLKSEISPQKCSPKCRRIDKKPRKNVLEAAPCKENATKKPKNSRKKVHEEKLISSIKKKITKLPSKNRKSKTEFEQARELLHISATPACLPCRENEFQQIFSFVEGKLLDSTGGCMYVSGVPGTGKTATVHEVVRVLRDCEKDGSVPAFKFIEVNSMKLTKPHQLYVQFWEKLTGSQVTAEHACTLIEKMLSTPNPKQTSIFLLLDELDLLWTKKQDVMYNLFDWSSRLESRLIVVAIANTMDLPERMMISRVSSRLGLTRMTFHPYTFQQLQEIIASRLVGVKAFDPDAVQLVARKVAAVSGDARRALDVCRRATELAEKNPHLIKATPRKSNKLLVGMAHVSDAISEMFSSPKIMAIRRCSQMVKYLLQAILEEFKRIGIEEAVLDKVIGHLQGICRIDGIVPPTSSETLFLINNLSAQRIIFMEHSRLDLALRLRLNISVDDVSYALSV